MKPAKLCAVLLLILSFCGCSDFSLPQATEDEGRYIALESPYYYDTYTNKIQSIESALSDSFYLYFIQGNIAFYSENSDSQSVNLYALNLDNYKKTLLYRSGKSYDYDGFLGLDMLFPKLSESSYDSSVLRPNENTRCYGNLMYTYKNGKILKTDLKTLKQNSIYGELNISSAFLMNGSFYIIDTARKLYLADLQAEALTLICDNFNCDSFLLYGNTGFYINYGEENKIYNLCDNSVFYESNTTLSFAYLTESMLFIYGNTDGSLYYSSTTEANFKKLANAPQQKILYVEKNIIYFFDGETVTPFKFQNG